MIEQMVGCNGLACCDLLALLLLLATFCVLKREDRRREIAALEGPQTQTKPMP